VARRKIKPAHYRGSYATTAAAVRRRAEADPGTVCQATVCIGWGTRTIAEHPHHQSGRAPHWEAGHVIDGQAGGRLRPEVSVCNNQAGGRRGAAIRNGRTGNRGSRTWLTAEPPRRP
jgi:hypothetical protein